jgi:hypothetical protein
MEDMQYSGHRHTPYLILLSIGIIAVGAILLVLFGNFGSGIGDIPAAKFDDNFCGYLLSPFVNLSDVASYDDIGDGVIVRRMNVYDNEGMKNVYIEFVEFNDSLIVRQCGVDIQSMVSVKRIADLVDRRYECVLNGIPRAVKFRSKISGALVIVKESVVSERINITRRLGANEIPANLSVDEKAGLLQNTMSAEVDLDALGIPRFTESVVFINPLFGNVFTEEVKKLESGQCVSSYSGVDLGVENFVSAP